MTRSWAWPINSPREKTSATRPSWPRGTRLDNCQIFFAKNILSSFSSTRYQLVTASGLTCKILRTKEWLNEKIRPKQTSIILVSKKRTLPWRVFFNGIIRIMENSSVPTTIHSNRPTQDHRGPKKQKDSYPYLSCNLCTYWCLIIPPPMISFIDWKSQIIECKIG